MSRTAIWLANGVLVVLCCFLVARILTEVAAEVLVPAPAAASVAPRVAAVSASWADREKILERDLFKSATKSESLPPPPAEEEVYAKTRLPVRLLATVAGRPEHSWAAVEDLDSREVHVVKVSDQLKGRAEVTRIERRRIVLRNAGRLEELALDEEPQGKQARPRARPRRTARRSPAGVNERIQRLAEDRFSVSRSDVQSVAKNPAELFSQARILPKYESGQMVGVQLNAIKAGSLFEQIGIQNGDIIKDLNGIEITNQQDSANVLRELTEASEFNVTVQGSDGSTRTLTYETR